MPMAIPLIAAGASIYAGVAAATMGAMVAGGVMIAGGAMTAIGAVTKNQRLMKIGGIVSLVGGVGALATGALSALASEASVAPTSVQSAIGGAAQDGLLAAEQAAAGSGAGAAPMAAEAGGATGAADTAAAPIAAPIAAQETAPVQAAQPAAQAGQSAGQSAGEAYRAGEIATRSGAYGGIKPVASVSAPGDWSSTLGKVTDWMERNKALTQVGGGIVQGAMKNYSEQAAYEEQLREQARRRAEYSAGIVGLKMPTYVAPAPYAPTKG